MNLKPLRFIGESIEIDFDDDPALLKKPGCPDRFTWRDTRYEIVELVREWHDYGRRGRMASNMRPENAARARRRGSWGVGRDYYLVQTADGRFFELYYDRSPSAGDRRGGWFLYREMGQN